MEHKVFAPADDVTAIIGMLHKELADPARPLTLLVHFRVHAGVSARVRALFAEARIPTLRDKGCMAFDLNEHPSDSRSFVVHEKWNSLADLDAHLRTSHASGLRAAYNDLIEGLPEFTVLVPVG